jgi:hypothetical protein
MHRERLFKIAHSPAQRTIVRGPRERKCGSQATRGREADWTKLKAELAAKRIRVALDLPTSDLPVRFVGMLSCSRDE